MVLVRLEPLAPRDELVDRNELERAPLPRHQQVHLAERLADARAQAPERRVVAFVAVHGRLPRPHELDVLRAQHFDRVAEILEMAREHVEPLVILRAQRVRDHALQAGDSRAQLVGRRARVALEARRELAPSARS